LAMLLSLQNECVNAYAINDGSIHQSAAAAESGSSSPRFMSRIQRQAGILQRARAARDKDRDRNKGAQEAKASGSKDMFAYSGNDNGFPNAFDFEIPSRELKPPFPDGPCNGRIVTLPASDHYILHNQLSSSYGTPDLPPRDITVWLPPDYDNPQYKNMRFPVLYCHDGQNAMEDKTSWTGYSWRMAGALTRLSERKLLSTSKTTEVHSPPIVVMIPCAEEKLSSFMPVPRRHLEYGDISQPYAQAHADFVALTLKPLMDGMFRTRSGVECTSVIGSSLGGQASLHLLLRYPQFFGNAACLSPAFQPSILTSVATMDVGSRGEDDDDDYDDRFSNSVSVTSFRDKTIYIDNGGDVDDVKVPFWDLHDHLSKEHWWNPGYWWLDSQLQPGIDAMKLALGVKGIPYTYKRFAGGRHNERAWASRIDKPLLCLYGNEHDTA